MIGDGRPVVIRPEYLTALVVSNLNRRLEVALGELADSQEALGALRDEDKRFREALGFDTSYPVHEVLRLLADAADHLLKAHDCDAHGWEVVGGARDAAREILKRLGISTP